MARIGCPGAGRVTGPGPAAPSRPGRSERRIQRDCLRNEQNKGGIIRIYAFTVSHPVEADYLGCGDLLPHNDYGSLTKAYFFESGAPAPTTLRLSPPHFDTTRFRPLAVYSKDKDGIGRVERVGME